MIRHLMVAIVRRLYGIKTYKFPLPSKKSIRIYAKDRKKALQMFNNYMEERRKTA